MVMVKEKVLDLANLISRTKRGAKDEVKPEHPEYIVLEPVVTDEMAEAALCLKFREGKTVEEIASECGKSPERTKELLWELAMAGATIVGEQEGVDKFWLELWVPGHMEMLVNHKENSIKYPQMGKAFSDYGRKRGPLAIGNFPVGTGPMRVIPIESAISGESKRVSNDEISKYLNDNDRFSVSDCSCRTAREAMGEGCGHLKEDMCIQLGNAAEYYIRTGRGREITREEAFEIIHKAEDNGLMHNMPNVDGPGHTHAICNCCGCGCLALRNANMLTNHDFVRSNYTVKVDADKCVACGECVEVCPTNALKLGQKLCKNTPIPKVERELPYNTEWTPDRWNEDYRLNREVVMEEGTAPCKAGCPAHIGVQGYIKLASQGKYAEALQLIKLENPFPAVCGRICPKFCEDDCTRCDIDGAVAVDDIKKFIAQQDMKAETRFVPKIKHDYDKKIAVIGAGPAGLSCAYYLAVQGYKVTVFEKQKALGGMLTLGIPSYRLEKDVINAEIDVLKDLGVEFKTGVEMGKDISLADLRTQDYKAFYMAIGAQAGRSLGLEGEDAEGVITGVEFLRHVNLGDHSKFEGNVIVIGGGNVAIDVARTATRVGAAQVDMFCLESREKMPAHAEEVEEALDEDINVNNSWGPKRIVAENGKVVGVEFRKCIAVFDADGKFNPSYDENDTKIVPADHVLLSVGQAMDWGSILADSKVVLNPNQTIQADVDTFQTGEPDIFAGGDALTGPRFAIDAIAHGKEGSISIHRYVQHGQSLVLGRLKRDYRAFDKANVNLAGYDTAPRQQTVHVDGKKSKETFKDLRETFTEEQVKKESARCLGCGVVIADEYTCVGCGACTTKCKFDAITLTRTYDADAVEFDKLKSTVIKHALKRKLRVAVNKPIKKIKAILSH
ncbi:MAG: NADPH-dependent glutamate synthase beta subunit-like oxidoreductase [Moritella dasanensis]|jgi:NADPH-dependent glutamate synthase beta subunit-like oxidoreductase